MVGWVAYAVNTLLAVVGDNRLMPPPDYPCRVINAKTGYVRENSSWIIGRIMRDYDHWMDSSVRSRLKEMLHARALATGNPNPEKVGLCVAVYKAQQAHPGRPGRDRLYFLGIATSLVQLVIASVPCIRHRNDWGPLLVTVCGIALSFSSGMLGQWSREKWSCRPNTDKTVIITNRDQHAIIVIGAGKGLDLEDLAGPARSSSSFITRAFVSIHAALWVMLLVASNGLDQHSWWILLIGALGMIQNIFVAGARRRPEAYGMPLEFQHLIATEKVMVTLFQVEDQYPGVGRSMLDSFFPGRLRPQEEEKWQRYDEIARLREEAESAHALTNQHTIPSPTPNDPNATIAPSLRSEKSSAIELPDQSCPLSEAPNQSTQRHRQARDSPS